MYLFKLKVNDVLAMMVSITMWTFIWD